MPASTRTQANYMKMALAVKHGHRVANISAKTRADLRETAKSMTDSQLRDFAKVAKKPKPKKKG